MTVTAIIVFMLSWSPYCFVSIAAMFKGSHVLTSGEAEIPELLAKASVIYNPIVYVAMNDNFRASLVRMMSCKIYSSVTPDGGIISPPTSREDIVKASARSERVMRKLEEWPLSWNHKNVLDLAQVQWNFDFSNFQGKREIGNFEIGNFEISGVKLQWKQVQGKQLLVREIGFFDKSRVREIDVPLYLDWKCTSPSPILFNSWMRKQWTGYSTGCKHFTRSMGYQLPSRYQSMHINLFIHEIAHKTLWLCQVAIRSLYCVANQLCSGPLRCTPRYRITIQLFLSSRLFSSTLSCVYLAFGAVLVSRLMQSCSRCLVLSS